MRARRSHASRALAALAALVSALLACDRRAPGAGDSGRADDTFADGYAVLSSLPDSAGLPARDTLREVGAAALPEPVRQAAERLADSLAYPRGCTRRFRSGARYLVRVAPFCGRELASGDDPTKHEELRLLAADGQAVSGVPQPLRGYLSTLCPAFRDEQGRLYPKRPRRFNDECTRAGADLPAQTLAEGTPTPLGVILPRAVTAGLLEQCSRPTPERADAEWAPTPAQIAAMERELPAYIARVAPESLAAPLERYRRQYGGFVVGADSLIYASFSLLPAAGPDTSRSWMTYVQHVCDGGRALFGIVYDPKRREFSELHFNSPG